MSLAQQKQSNKDCTDDWTQGTAARRDGVRHASRQAFRMRVASSFFCSQIESTPTRPLPRRKHAGLTQTVSGDNNLAHSKCTSTELDPKPARFQNQVLGKNNQTSPCKQRPRSSICASRSFYLLLFTALTLRNRPGLLPRPA